MANNRAATLLVMVILSACSSSPPVNFYTLEGPEADASSGAPAFPYSVAVGPVNVPETVNRSQLVVRIDPNQVAVLDEQQWAEPLKSGIAQTVAANLRVDLKDASVMPLAQSAGAAEYRVSIDVLRFDSMPGDAAVIDARWTIKHGKPETAPISDTTHIREPVQGESYAALVAAHSRALASLSQAIAKALVASRNTQ